MNKHLIDVLNDVINEHRRDYGNKPEAVRVAPRVYEVLEAEMDNVERRVRDDRMLLPMSVSGVIIIPEEKFTAFEVVDHD